MFYKINDLCNASNLTPLSERFTLCRAHLKYDKTYFANPKQLFLFSTMITRKIKDIDTLIDSLPSEDSTKRLQDAALESMNAGLK